MVHVVMSRNHFHEKYRNLVFSGRPICIIATIVSKKKHIPFLLANSCGFVVCTPPNLTVRPGK